MSKPNDPVEQMLERATEAALDAMCVIIQDHLGVKTGDFASLFFSGGQHREWVRAAATAYYEAERAEGE